HHAAARRRVRAVRGRTRGRGAVRGDDGRSALLARGSRGLRGAARRARRREAARPADRAARLAPGHPQITRHHMQRRFKVFDPHAHVVEPRDLWERFLDARHRHRVGWRQPFPGMDRFRPATVDGRYTQSTATLYGNQQEAVRWTTEAMIAKYGDVVRRGFDG